MDTFYNQCSYYKANREDEERGHRILHNPELFYYPEPWGVTPRANPHCITRESKLNDLKNSFSRMTAQGIFGLGGVGKTQLAVSYLTSVLDKEFTQ